MRELLKPLHFIYSVSSRNMAFVAPQSVPVITVPKYLEPKLKSLKAKHAKQEEENHLKLMRRGNRNVPVVSSKYESKLNHYLGQTYGKHNEIPLATKSWKKAKSIGDQLVFHAFSGNKAAEDLNDIDVTFSSLGLSDLVVEGISAMNFKKPVEIQRLAIPEILSQKNALISAETGCGKTLAYVAPIIDQIRRLKQKYIDDFTKKKSPFGVIVVPSRELAVQIGTVASTLGSFCGVGVTINIGGLPQRMPCTGQDLLVSTAGMLSLHIQRRIYDVRRVKVMVIDEADTLLDDSFFNDYIMDVFETIKFNDVNCAFASQLILVSATIPSDFRETLQNVVDVNSIERITTPQIHRVMPHVKQIFMRIHGRERTDKLLELARDNMKNKRPTIIFVNRTFMCDFLHDHLNEHEISCVKLNKSCDESERIENLRKFQNGDCNILVSTDLGSRGLDTRHVTRIINYDCPHHVADYIHRAGRTGRVGCNSTCLVTSFVSYKQDVDMLQQLEYSVRKQSMLENVNNNIKRFYKQHWQEKMNKLEARAAKKGYPTGLSE